MTFQRILKIKFFKTLFVPMFLPQCVYASARVCCNVIVMWEDSFQDFLLSFHSVGIGD